MKNRSRFLPKVLITSLFSFMILFFTLVPSGCGLETEQSNVIVGEVNLIMQNLEPKVEEANKLHADATDQLSKGQIEQEKASLTKAIQVIDEIIADLEVAKTKTEEAASLDLSEHYKQHLQIKAKVHESNIKIWQLNRATTSLFLADPVFDNPETTQKVSDIEAQVNAEINRLNELEAEADRIASENPDEIEQ